MTQLITPISESDLSRVDVFPLDSNIKGRVLSSSKTFMFGTCWTEYYMSLSSSIDWCPYYQRSRVSAVYTSAPFKCYRYVGLRTWRLLSSANASYAFVTLLAFLIRYRHHHYYSWWRNGGLWWGWRTSDIGSIKISSRCRCRSIRECLHCWRWK